DIDINAVEVTKLSLLLKSLEGETQASIAHQLSFYHERVLPTLDKNIKDGNSIIDTDYYDGQIDFGAAKKIKPFSWDDEFSEIKLNGGFDVVIGNPPYIKERGSKEIFEPVLKSRLGKLYHQGKMDFWYYFVHRGIDILKDNGYLGFITNSYWMKSDGASKLIERIGNNLIFDTIVDFDNYKVFEDVSGKHNISIFKKDSNKKTDCKVLSIEKQNPNSIIENYALELINNENLIQNSKIQLNSNINIFENCEILDIHFDTSVGVQESTDRITKKHKASTKREDINIGDGVFVLNENEILKANFNDEEKLLLKPYVNTSHINRYELDFRNEFLLYIGKTERQLIASGKYPNIKRHLDSVKEFITSSNAPYGIHRTREQRFFEEPKLICKGMFLQPEFYYDDEKYYFGFSFSSIIQKSRKYDLKLLLGIMNSKLGEFWFHLNGKRRGIGVDIGVKIFRLFPLPPKTNKNFDIISTKIIKLVEQLQSLKKDLKTQSLQTAKVQIERQIVYFEKRINEKVYKLYAFKKQEIEMIENKKNRLVNQPYLIQTL
ncbi:MAG: Eco57I restriction-modification methylase domain-containing protein, partial [Bacteroidales bacterium]|nr:Eco57I restriction-modification methylase domain-containing protein [Bacteroidales bacterium]